ncbi:MAG TPA: hypothetical protein VGM77_01365 [Gemmatimonadales bacterium]|jgi:hypothetical protein
MRASTRLTITLLALATVACGAADTGGEITPPPAPPPSPPPVTSAPLQMTVTPLSRRATTQPGSVAPSDNAAVTFSGDGATTAAWSATHRQSWSSLITASGAGAGSVTWARSAQGLAAGIYVDTITITSPGATGSPAQLLDTLQVTATPVQLALTVSPRGRVTAVVQGGVAPDDNAAVTLTGDGAGTTAWTVTGGAAWTTITTGAGTGSGTVSWHRQAAALAVGVHVDTLIIVAPGAAGSPATVVDTLRITAPPVPTMLAVTPASNRVAVTQGSSAGPGVAAVTITGDNAAGVSWIATARKAWTTLTTASGSGPGTVAWTRATAALTPGTWIDTITVTANVVSGSPARIIDSIVVTAVSQGGLPDLGLNADLHGIAIFPATSLWNQPVDTAQVDPASAAILAAIGLTKPLHPDFGANYDGGPFGIPYIVVPDGQTRYTPTFDYSGESDPGPYPIPPNPPIEPGGGDDHLLVITQGEQKLYELYDLSGSGSTWHAGSGAIWDLIHGTTRPAGWTSADAAGLPILPGLVRYDEVSQRGEIDHALRFTVVHTRNAYLAPASHAASSSSNPLYPPMGMRVRLRAAFDVSGYPPAAQVVLRALKKYGMMVADNGSDFYLSGTADARWDDDVNNTLKQVKVSDFEVVRMTGVVVP